MPRRWTAALPATSPGRLKRLEDELHEQWARWKAHRIATQEERATANRFERLRAELTREPAG